MFPTRKYNASQISYPFLYSHVQHLHNNSTNNSSNHHTEDAGLDIASSACEFDGWFGHRCVAAWCEYWENRFCRCWNGLATIVDGNSDGASGDLVSNLVDGLGDGADFGGGLSDGGSSVASADGVFLLAEPDLVYLNLEDDLPDGLADISSLNDGDGLGGCLGAVTLEREDIGLSIDDVGVGAIDSIELVSVAGVDVTRDLDVGLTLECVHCN